MISFTITRTVKRDLSEAEVACAWGWRVPTARPAAQSIFTLESLTGLCIFAQNLKES